MVRHGAELTTRVASGVVRSRVIDEEDKRAAEPSKKKPRIRSRKTLGREEPPQMDLF
jgi:hypothetical protein